MSAAASPKIVSNSLFLHLDAGNRKSYPGSGTSWYDLSGRGYTTTLTNGPTYSASNGGIFSFNGTGQYGSVGSTSTAFTSATMSCFVNFAATQNSWTGLIFNRGTGVNGFHVGGSNSLSITWNGSYGWNSGIIPTNGSWVMTAMTMSTGGTATIYIFSSSGVSTATNSGYTASMSIGDTLQIGIDPGYGEYRNLNGSMGNAMIYTRALTQTELQQNFYALRGRYGI